MIKYPPPADPSRRRYDAFGFFSCKNRREGPFQVALDFAVAGPGKIEGYVLGDDSTFEHLRFPPAPVSFAGEAIAGERVVADWVDFEWLAQVPGPAESRGLVARFECAELVIEESIEAGGEEAESANFFLCGPTQLWGVWHTFGSRDPDAFNNTAIEIPGVPFSVEIRPVRFGWFDDDTEHQTLTYVHRLRITANSSAEPSGTFIPDATLLAQDILLLMSLLSQQWIHFFERSAVTRGLRSRLRRGNLVIHEAREIDHQNNPAGRNHTREFLSSCLPALRSLREGGVDLRDPISFLIIAASGGGTSTEQFASAFQSLESLKSLNVTSLGGGSILPADSFRELEAELHSVISSRVPDKQTRARLYAKLRDLNRPAFSELLKGMLAHYHVQWHDLYPPGVDLTKPPLIAVRDNLFHAGQQPSNERLVLETERVRGLATRVILRMLGWHDIANTPVGPFRYEIRRTWSLDGADEPKGRTGIE